MADEIKRKRLAKRRKMAERRRLAKEQEVFEQQKNFRIILFIKLGIFAVLFFIPVDFFINIYPTMINATYAPEVTGVAFLVWQILGIIFGLGLYYAGKRMTRNSGIYGGIFQVDGSIIGAIGFAVVLIVNPLQYTQESVIINSLYYGLQTVSAFSLLFFGLLIGFFFVLVGSNSQKQPLKYVVIITGILWLINLFLPMIRPPIQADFTVYLIFTSFTWFIYCITAYCLWKILTDYEGLIPATTAPYRIK
ncbi:MAG: hypothetical protein HWN65_00890 [Candidatus Helarchaeota archaeon]|nr:hypothetical protein [Candidatus Helarchaeota archaeon]